MDNGSVYFARHHLASSTSTSAFVEANKKEVMEEKNKGTLLLRQPVSRNILYMGSLHTDVKYNKFISA